MTGRSAPALLGGVIFDFDGTVLDTESADYRSVAEVWADHGHELTLERWLPSVGSVAPFDWLGELEDRVGRRLDGRALRQQRFARSLALIAEEDLRPGVAALLESCAEADLPVAVASNAPTTWVEGHLDRLGWRHRFVAVVCADQVPAPKPAPDVYLAALAAMDRPAAAVVAIEDSPYGVLAARAAGLACLGVHGALSSLLDLSAADRVVDDLDGVGLADLARLLSPARPGPRPRP